MVAIKNHEADRFVRSRSADIWLYLFCGPDAGLVAERAHSIVRAAVANPRDPFQLLRLDGDQIASDPGKLADEANTIGLFGGSRCIHIDAGSKTFAPAIEDLIADPPQDCVVVISAGDLKGDSPLRKLVTRYAKGAAVECYPDTMKQLELIVDEEMKRAGLTITPGAREFLTSHLGADRLVTRSELEKLVLYASGQGIINEGHVEAVIADAAALSIDEAIFIAFNGDYRTAIEAGQKTFSQLDPGVFMGFLLRHILFLHRMRIDLDRGVSLDSIGERLPRNYFGQKRTLILNQIKAWSATRLLQIAAEIATASAHARRDSRSADRLAMRCLWWIVRGSRRAS